MRRVQVALRLRSMRLYVKDSARRTLNFRCVLAGFEKTAEMKDTAHRQGALARIQHFWSVIIKRRDEHYPDLTFMISEADCGTVRDGVRGHRDCVSCNIVIKHDFDNGGRLVTIAITVYNL